jgi:hypothetical protein
MQGVCCTWRSQVHSTSLRRGRFGALFAVALLAGSGFAAAAQAEVPADVGIRYQLTPEFTGTAKAGGRIVLTLTNRSSRALPEVTVRLADASLGRLTGPVQESVALAAGETRQLEGEFVLNADVLRGARPFDWIVVYTDPEGFAQQRVVRGEALQPSATMDADARTAAH